MVDLSVELAGIRLPFPTALSSGPLSRDGVTIRKAAQQHGVGAVFTKTIMEKYEDTPRPSMAAVKGGLLNYDWQAPGISEFAEKELKIAKEGGKPVIANALGLTVDASVKLATALEKAGADMFELPVTAAPLEVITETVKAVKEAISIPFIVKLGPDIPDIPSYAKAIENAGADAISGINTFGPCLSIDVYTGKPLLGAKSGYGYLSGSAIKPLAVKCVAEIAMAVRIPVLGGGGISNGEDAVEMFMAGATCVHLHTAALLRGLGVFSKIVNKVEGFMRKMGYESLEDIRGISLKFLRREATYDLFPATVEAELCNGCGACERVCAYDAVRIVEGIARIERESCFGCGLCKSICSTRAISLRKE